MKRRLSLAGIWIVSVLEALAMGIAGLSKFGGAGRSQVLFGQVNHVRGSGRGCVRTLS